MVESWLFLIERINFQCSRILQWRMDAKDKRQIKKYNQEEEKRVQSVDLIEEDGLGEQTQSQTPKCCNVHRFKFFLRNTIKQVI